MTTYLRHKGPRVERCRLCGQTAEMTWDHVPPQAGIVLQPVEIEAVYRSLTGTKREFTISQNGLKYRTLCKPCNSLLGAKYDPVLNDFAIGVGRYLYTEFHLPASLSYRTRPGALMRAVLGHLLATKSTTDASLVDQAFQPYVLDEQLPLPQDLYVYYCVYPYEQTVVARDFARLDTTRPRDNMGVISVLKYFPIAYMVATGPIAYGLGDLTPFGYAAPDTWASVPINLRHIPAINWPEGIDDTTAIMTTSATKDAVRAVPRRKEA